MPLERTRELVLEKVHESFPDPLIAQDAIDLLDLYGSESWQNERERVQLAILMISDGDITRLCDYVELACSDYRDVLVRAEYPEAFFAPYYTTKEEMVELDKYDREQYEAWLTTGAKKVWLNKR